MENKTIYKKKIYELGYALKYNRTWGVWQAEHVNPNTVPAAWAANTLESLYSSLKGFTYTLHLKRGIYS